MIEFFLRYNNKKKKQNDLAEYLGIKHVAVSNWKTGKTVPNIENLEKIATFLNVSLDFLITGKEHTTNTSSDIFFSYENKKNTPSSTLGLTEMSAELIGVFEQLNLKNKTVVLSYTIDLLEEQNKK